MELYYPCSKNKVADQLRGYRKADVSLLTRMNAKCLFSHDAAQVMIWDRGIYEPPLDGWIPYNKNKIFFHCLM